MNDDVYGPLLDKCPSAETIEDETSDCDGEGTRPGEM